MNIIVIRLYAVFVQDELRLRRGVYNRLYVSIKLITAFLNSIVLWQKAKNVKLPCLTILLNNDTCSILCVNAAEILFVLLDESVDVLLHALNQRLNVLAVDTFFFCYLL
jgi:hypothetical protein